jgi:hypothetical protein
MARGGKKRRTGKREPNGKLSRRIVDKQARRSIDEQSTMQVAKEARQRVFGVSEADSATELAGTVCGRLFLAREITQQQLDAAKAFAETYATYQRAMNSPRPPKAVEIGGITGGGALRDISPEQHVKAKERWDAAVKVLVEANHYHPGSIYAACDYLALRDELHPHMVGDFRVGMNSLARHYGLVARRAA